MWTDSMSHLATERSRGRGARRLRPLLSTGFYRQAAAVTAVTDPGPAQLQRAIREDPFDGLAPPILASGQRCECVSSVSAALACPTRAWTTCRAPPRHPRACWPWRTRRGHRKVTESCDTTRIARHSRG